MSAKNTGADADRQQSPAATLSRPASNDFGEPENLEPLFPSGAGRTLAEWHKLREGLKVRWSEVMGQPSFYLPPDPISDG